MHPDSTFMSDMTGTRDKGVGTREEVTSGLWLVASEEVLSVMQKGTRDQGVGTSVLLRSSDWLIRKLGDREAGRREPTAAASQQ